jgi:predicted membrane metal-binding protein
MSIFVSCYFAETVTTTIQKQTRYLNTIKKLVIRTIPPGRTGKKGTKIFIGRTGNLKISKSNAGPGGACL